MTTTPVLDTIFDLFPAQDFDSPLPSPLDDLDSPLPSPPTLDDLDFDERVAQRHIESMIGFDDMDDPISFAQDLDDQTPVPQDLTLREMMGIDPDEDEALTEIDVVMGLLPRDVLDDFDEEDLRGSFDFDEFGESQQRTMIF